MRGYHAGHSDSNRLVVAVKSESVIDAQRYKVTDLAKGVKQRLDNIWNYPYPVKTEHVAKITRCVACNQCRGEGATVPKGKGKGKRPST
mmetsp:Transcript_95856/g.214575  ORF Transcript_95856/g.214575 Transcript_95856/m.214575 type:complete len:89 (+) Transcript_95856:2-268(+)